MPFDGLVAAPRLTPVVAGCLLGSLTMHHHPR
jgi:hypothetical protein